MECVLAVLTQQVVLQFTYNRSTSSNQKSTLFPLYHDRRLIPRSSLPRIENALPGRDGYEVEIFGMEGIPAPDVADYKRRKEIELGLTAGSISQPQAKRPKTENRPFSEEELRAQLEAHKALMGAHETPAPAPTDTNQSAVYAATPQTYVASPAPAPPGSVPPVPVVPTGAPPAFLGMPPPPGAFPGAPPFPPQLPGMPGMPPG